MLSALNCSTLPLDTPSPPCDPSTTHPAEKSPAHLNFDDLLDIAREYEFTRTITHTWPCEEHTTGHEMGLEDILATIVHTPAAQQIPVPMSTATMTLDPVRVRDDGPQTSASMRPAPEENASISAEPAPSQRDDGLVGTKAEPAITSTLRGWCPPNGSQFLDLDDGLLLPQSMQDTWHPPWLATLLAPSSHTHPAITISQSSGTLPVVDGEQPHKSATELKATPFSTKAADVPRKMTVPPVPLPAQHPKRAVLASVRAGGQTSITPHAKTLKSRSHQFSASATGGTPTRKYAKAPRGGIPPHIARTVTKANILRIEKERKVMLDAFSSSTAGDGRKPSVLRTATKVQRETNRIINGGGGGRKLFDWGEGGRVAKRAKV